MTTIYDWPAVLVPRDVQIRNPRRTVGGSSSLSGMDQVAVAVRPPFGLRLEFDWLTGDEVLAWRALLGALEGRANVVRVPVFDLWLAAGNAALGIGLAPHSDGSHFSDGAMYLTSDMSGVTMSGVRGQRTVGIDFGSYGQILQAGQYFGIGERPYLATGVSWAGSVASVRITPTLRSDVTAQPVKLRPTMLARLIDDDAGQTPLEMMRQMRPQVDFTEAFGVDLP